jgi:hypothetical protein
MWLVSEKICREKVGSVPTLLLVASLFSSTARCKALQSLYCTIRRLLVDYSRTIRTIRRLFADYSYYSSTLRGLFVLFVDYSHYSLHYSSFINYRLELTEKKRLHINYKLYSIKGLRNLHGNKKEDHVIATCSIDSMSNLNQLWVNHNLRFQHLFSVGINSNSN